MNEPETYTCKQIRVVKEDENNICSLMNLDIFVIKISFNFELIRRWYIKRECPTKFNYSNRKSAHQNSRLQIKRDVQGTIYKRF